MILKIFDRFKVRKVEFFNEFALSLKYDSFGSAFSFVFLFDPDNPEHKELACVTHYHDCVVEHNNETLITGFAIVQTFKYQSTKQLAIIKGYSKPGLFEDVSIPPTIYPLQSDGLSLLQISNKLTSSWNNSTKYKIGTIVDPSVSSKMNKVFPKSTASENETIGDYLKSLAQQKRVIISHDENGNLVYTSAKTEKEPIISFDFRNGMIPGTHFDLSFDGRAMFSHITVMRQASIDGGNAGEYTIRNPYVPVFYRPKVVTQSSGDDIDTEEVAKRELAKELENLSLTIKTDRWEIDGKIIKPNNMIEIFAPELFVYERSKFFIRSIDFEGDQEKTIATINCIVPEAVNGMTPTSIFEGINMHP